MATVVVELVIDPATDFALGDVVRVFEPHPNLLANRVCNLQRQAYIFVENFPLAQLENVRSWMESPDVNESGEHIGAREWGLDFSTVTPANAAQIMTYPHTITYQWADIQSHFVQKKANASQKILSELAQGKKP